MKKRIALWILMTFLLLTLIPFAAASNQDTKLIALTFDDGPCQYTERLLDGLAERGVKATFFVQGVKAEQYPDVIRRMLEEGHQVGNHSYDHPNLSQLELNAAVKQLEDTNRILDEITGGNGGYAYRAPYGSSTLTLRMKMGAPFFKWSADSLDWSLKHSGLIYNQLLQSVHDGAIVLLHDTVYHTTDAVLRAIDTLQNQGYEFVTVEELCRRRGVDSAAGCDDLYECLPALEQKSALERPTIQTEKTGNRIRVSLDSDSDVPIYYTIDGSPVLCNGTVYRGAFTVSSSCTIRAVAASDLNGCRSEETVLAVSLDEEEMASTDVSDQAYLSRGLFAQLLYEMEDDHYVQACKLFSDVPLDHPQAEAITWAYASGIFDGTGAETFEPSRYVSREEVAKVLQSVLKPKPCDEVPEFRDVDKISSWARDSVCAIVKLGLLKGGTDGYFRPQDTMTGAQVKLVLERMSSMK